jgi:hypothetical protein
MGPSLAVLALPGLFVVPFLRRQILLQDGGLKSWMMIKGPWLFKRSQNSAEQYKIPVYSFVQEKDKPASIPVEGLVVCEVSSSEVSAATTPPLFEAMEMDLNPQNGGELKTALQVVADKKKRARASTEEKSTGLFGWAVRTIYKNQTSGGKFYKSNDLKVIAKLLLAKTIYVAMCGFNYDIHSSSGVLDDTPEGKRLLAMYDRARLNENAVEHVYATLQLLTASSASFGHGFNDIGNAAGPWVAILDAWKLGRISDAPAQWWHLLILAAFISLGLFTYGYNIMTGSSFLLTLRSKHQANNTKQSDGQQNYSTVTCQRCFDTNGHIHHRSYLQLVLPPRFEFNVCDWSNGWSKTCQQHDVEAVQYSLESCQLPASRLSLLRLGRYSSCYRDNIFHTYEDIAQCSPVCQIELGQRYGLVLVSFVLQQGGLLGAGVPY